MGQAKQRGTKEERIEQGLLRKEDEETRRLEQKASYEAALSPEERKKRKQARLKFNSIMAVVAGLTANLK